jgi:ABC-type glycerol-3-phosphate transport system substrate-binding protein
LEPIDPSARQRVGARAQSARRAQARCRRRCRWCVRRVPCCLRRTGWKRGEPGRIGASSGPVASAALSVAPTQQALSGPITVLVGGGDPGSEPALKKVYDDFKAQHPAIEWDIRAPAGPGPEWDRLARASLESGEPVGLVILDGLFVRAWTRDGLLADLGADPRLADVLARVPAAVPSRRSRASPPPGVPLALSRGVQTTGLYYNKALLDRAGSRSRDDRRPQGDGQAAGGARRTAPLVHCAGDAPFNPLLVMWLLPMIAERTGDPLEFVESTIKGEVRYDSPEWIEAFQVIADLRTSGVLLDGSGATDYATMQLSATAGQGGHDLQRDVAPAALQAGTPTVPFDLHVAPTAADDAALEARSILSWAGFALPAKAPGRDSVDAFLEYASRPDIDRSVVGWPPVVLADRRVEHRDPRPDRARVPADVRGRDHVAQLAMGAGDRRRDRQPGPGPRQRRSPTPVGRRGGRGRGRGAPFVGTQLEPSGVSWRP